MNFYYKYGCRYGLRGVWWCVGGSFNIFYFLKGEVGKGGICKF